MTIMAHVPASTECPESTGGGQGAFATQVGGDHYASMKIQPFQISEANGLSAYAHTALKYIMRADKLREPVNGKGGALDIDKAIDTLQKMKADRYGA